jgi:transcriptional regulator with XRE-family HTH domain
MSTEKIKKISIKQVKAARMLLGWSQADLGDAAGLGRVTVPRIEAIDGELGGRSKTREKIRTALEKAGVEFLAEDDGGPGVRLRKAKRKGKSDV